MALYPNIDRSILLSLLETHTTNTIVRLTDFVLKATFLHYRNHVYRQIAGIPMGTNAAVNLANFYLGKLIDPFLINHEGVHFYNRYIDDCFFFWSQGLDSLSTFLAEANNLSENIKFTMVIGTDHLDVLDIRIFKKNDSTFGTKTFSKAMNKFLYIPKKSYHPPHVFTGFIKGELIRYQRLSSDPIDYYLKKIKFGNHLLQRGYSRAHISKIFSNHNHRSLQNLQKLNFKMCVPFKIRYSANPELYNITKELKLLNQRIPYRFIMCWKKSKSLFSYLVKSNLSPEQIEILGPLPDISNP